MKIFDINVTKNTTNSSSSYICKIIFNYSQIIYKSIAHRGEGYGSYGLETWPQGLLSRLKPGFLGLVVIVLVMPVLFS